VLEEGAAILFKESTSHMLFHKCIKFKEVPLDKIKFFCVTDESKDPLFDTSLFNKLKNELKRDYKCQCGLNTQLQEKKIKLVKLELPRAIKFY
jgi:hypothetical protein